MSVVVRGSPFEQEAVPEQQDPEKKKEGEGNSKELQISASIDITSRYGDGIRNHDVVCDGVRQLSSDHFLSVANLHGERYLQPPTHSFTHLLIYSLTHSLTHSLTYLFTY